jgi:short-subunit dehydrogenase
VQQLRGRNALITGAAGGLGEYIARSLAAEGVNLVLSDLTEEGLEQRATELRSGGIEVESLSADLTQREQVGGLFDRAEDAIGPVDILVNNAGLEFAGPFLERSPNEIAGTTEVNLVALMLITHSALPRMLERGRGHVVNIASLAGKLSFPYLAAYSASKHGVVGFTGSLRGEYRDSPVGFSAICPGFISRVGMYGRLEDRVGDTPGPIRPSPPEHVGEGVVKAIRGDLPLVIVNPPGARALILVNAVAPRLAGWIGRSRAIREFADRFAQVKREAPPTPAEERVRAPD